MIAQERFQAQYMPMPSMPQAMSPLTGQVDLVRKLIASMMVGQMYGITDQVALIFGLLSKMLGDARHLRISLAIAGAMGGDNQPARDLLAEGMDDWPSADAAKVSVAMALRIGGDPEWVRVCEHTLAVSNDNDARLFARQLLEQRR